MKPPVWKYLAKTYGVPVALFFAVFLLLVCASELSAVRADLYNLRELLLKIK